MSAGPDRLRLTAAILMERSNASDQDVFARHAEYAAELAVDIARRVPDRDGVVSNDLVRLQQSVSLLLRMASKIEANVEAVAIMKSEEKTP